MDKPQAEDLTPAKRILVVEDEFITAKALKSDLLKLGYKVLAIVDTGEEAILKAAELMPDLVLMDITLLSPMSGIKAAIEIKKSLGIPIIYLTAHSDAETIEKAKISEPFGYLPKPCNVATMRSTIEMALYKFEADAARQKTAEALARLQNEQRIILENLGAGVLFIKNRKIIWANPFIPKIFGYAVGEIAGQDTEILYCDQETYRKVGAEGYIVLGRGEIYTCQLQMKKKDGTFFWCKIIGQAVNPTQLEEGTLWILEDFSEHKYCRRSGNQQFWPI